MSNVYPSVDEQFKDIQERIIDRMVKDAALLMYLNRAWYNNPPESADSGCLNFISGGYAISIKRKS